MISGDVPKLSAGPSWPHPTRRGEQPGADAEAIHTVSMEAEGGWKNSAISKRLGFLRWVLPVLIALIVFVYQSYLVNYIHGTLGEEGHLYAEIVLYGLIGPAITFFILSWILRWQREREHFLEEFREQEVQLTSQKLEQGKRIARHLHREVLPTLAYVANKLDHSQKQIVSQQKQDAGFVQALGEISGTLRATTRELRENINNLRLGLPLKEGQEENDLVESLKKRIDLFGTRFQLSAELVIAGSAIALPYDLEQAIVRIIGEALNNIALHSGAQHARIKLDFGDSNHLQLVIMDEGKGFDVQRVLSGSAGLGFKHIREEASHFQGELRIESSRGKGTTIVVNFPFYREDGHDGED